MMVPSRKYPSAKVTFVSDKTTAAAIFGVKPNNLYILVIHTRTLIRCTRSVTVYHP